MDCECVARRQAAPAAAVVVETGVVNDRLSPACLGLGREYKLARVDTEYFCAKHRELDETDSAMKCHRNAIDDQKWTPSFAQRVCTLAFEAKRKRVRYYFPIQCVVAGARKGMSLNEAAAQCEQSI